MPQELEWLRAPLVCEGRTIRPSLSPDVLSDNDLPDICLRMHLILDTIEFERCEGRLINTDIFDPIDTLESDLQHREDNRLVDWCDTIRRFGEHYHLAGDQPIQVASRAIDGIRWMAQKFNIRLHLDDIA
jgi:hypothetical protein